MTILAAIGVKLDEIRKRSGGAAEFRALRDLFFVLQFRGGDFLGSDEFQNWYEGRLLGIELDLDVPTHRFEGDHDVRRAFELIEVCRNARE